MSFPLPEPMRTALDEARAAAEAGEVPVAAVVSRGGAVLATGRNRMRELNDPTAHAEMVAMRAAAAALGQPRLARVERLYFAASDPKGGAVLHGPRLFAQPTCHHAPEVYPGIGEAEAADLLRAFFRERR
jgi:tRNA(adenine34) deaminase